MIERHDGSRSPIEESLRPMDLGMFVCASGAYVRSW